MEPLHVHAHKRWKEFEWELSKFKTNIHAIVTLIYYHSVSLFLFVLYKELRFIDFQTFFLSFRTFKHDWKFWITNGYNNMEQ